MGKSDGVFSSRGAHDSWTCTLRQHSMMVHALVEACDSGDHGQDMYADKQGVTLAT